MRSGPVGNAVALSMDVNVEPDGRFLAFTALLCLVTGIRFGLAPALRASSVTLTPSLTGRGADSTTSRGRLRPGKLLVVSQVAVSLVLLIGAGLFLRTLQNLTTQDPALALARLVASRLFGVGQSDVVTITGAIGVIVALAAVAGVLPARRAARVDPMIALRAE
jgi:hypothetical protein